MADGEQDDSQERETAPEDVPAEDVSAPEAAVPPEDMTAEDAAPQGETAPDDTAPDDAAPEDGAAPDDLPAGDQPQTSAAEPEPEPQPASDVASEDTWTDTSDADAAASASDESTPAESSMPSAGPAPEEDPRQAVSSVGLELYLLRHADAGDPELWSGDDADRPLSSKGRKQAGKLGDLLADLGWKPDTILTSPKARAADTARRFGKKVRAKARVDQRLGADLDSTELGSLLADLDAAVTRVVLVGHDPDFSFLASWLVGAPVSLRKGALARIDLPDRSLGAGRGELRWLLPPDAVPG